MSESFESLVYVSTLDELNIILMEQYNEKNSYTSYNGKICEGYTIKERVFNKTYFEKLDPSKFTQSTVGKGKEDVIDTSKRSSKIYKKANILIRNKYESYNRSINTTKINPLKDSLECEYSYDVDLIKYETGDHFDEYHYDTFRNGTVATLLIFPPTSMIGEYTGGDLVFKINDVEHRICPSSFTDKFMCVIFGYVLHKCEPVTSGTRYVIKSTIKAKLPNILSDKNKFKIEDIEQSNTIELDETKNSEIIENKIDELKSIIKEYNEIKTKYLLDNLPDKLNLDLDEYDSSTQSELSDLNDEYIDLKKEIKFLKNTNINYEIGYYLDRAKYNVCVLPYYVEDMTNLSLYRLNTKKYMKNLIKEGWNITYMYNTFNFKTDYDDGDRKLYGNDFDNDEDYRYSNYKYHYTYDDIENGKCIDYHSEYNDESGNDVYEEYKCSCLLIWR
jgi:hypothetical protein